MQHKLSRSISRSAMYWLGFSRCTSNTHTKPTTLSTFICVSGVKPPTHLNSPNQTSLHLTVQIFSLGCVVAERHLIAHTHTLPLSRPTVSASSQSVGISSKYLSQTKRSICPPVCLRWPSTPNSSPAPLSRPHLTLAADWLASSSVASVCVCVWQCFCFLEWWGRDDVGLLVGGALPSGADGRRLSSASRD